MTQGQRSLFRTLTPGRVVGPSPVGIIPSHCLRCTTWPKARTRATKILLPCAAPGIAVGIILSAGRALAETAVLLFTAGYVLRRPDSLFDSGRTLSVHIYDLAMNVPGGMPRAAATAVVLVAVMVEEDAVAKLVEMMAVAMAGPVVSVVVAVAECRAQSHLQTVGYDPCTY